MASLKSLPVNATDLKHLTIAFYGINEGTAEYGYAKNDRIGSSMPKPFLPII